MVKVFSAPVEVGPAPKPDYSKGFSAVEKQENAWVNKIKAYAKKHGKGQYRGKELAIGHADGAARYVVFTNSSIIHLPVGDAWDSPLAHRLLARDIPRYIPMTNKEFQSLGR